MGDRRGPLKRQELKQSVSEREREYSDTALDSMRSVMLFLIIKYVHLF